MQNEPLKNNETNEEEEKVQATWFTPRRLIALILAIVLILATTGITYIIRSAREKAEEDPEPVQEDEQTEVIELPDYLTETEVSILSDPENEIGIAYNKAVELLGQERYAEALSYVMNCIPLVDKAACPNLYSDLYLKKACIEVYSGDDNTAVMSLHEALDAKDDLAEAYLLLSGIYSDRGELSRAQTALLTYTEISGDDSAWYNLAVWAMQSEDFAKAKEYFTSYIDGYLQGGADDSRYFRGVCSLALEEYDDAITDFTVCITRGLYASDSLFDRALCYILTDDYVRALDDFNLCVENGINPEESASYRDMCMDILNAAEGTEEE